MKIEIYKHEKGGLVKSESFTFSEYRSFDPPKGWEIRLISFLTSDLVIVYLTKEAQ